MNIVDDRYCDKYILLKKFETNTSKERLLEERREEIKKEERETIKRKKKVPLTLCSNKTCHLNSLKKS